MKNTDSGPKKARTARDSRGSGFFRYSMFMRMFDDGCGKIQERIRSV